MNVVPRGALARVLSAIGYRRLELFALDLTTGSEVSSPGVEVEYGFATGDDVDALENLRPGLGATARERFAHGERCFVGRADGEIVMARWVARGRARIAFVRFELPLADDESYGFDTWTSPTVRGLGVASAGGSHLRNALRAEGVRTAVRAVWAANDDGMRNAAREGFAAVGYVVRVGHGGFGHTWVRRTARPSPH